MMTNTRSEDAPTSPGKPDTTAEVRRTRYVSQGLVELGRRINQEPEFIFDVVIVGSGYGGSVAAQQLAGLIKKNSNHSNEKLSVCILERGAEYLPGMFPSTLGELPGHVRYCAQGTGAVTGNHEGLFDVRLGSDVAALVANGLGGGSLINAGVMLAPDFKNFESKLPAAVVADLEAKYLGCARRLLVGDPLAVTNPNAVKASKLYAVHREPAAMPLKYQRLAELAEQSGQNLMHGPADISVAHADTIASGHSVAMTACNACGDCLTGCNVGAKASLDTNLLAQAHALGADIYTGASVLKLARTPASPSASSNVPAPSRLWQLKVVHTSLALRQRETHALHVKARHVILAAGTLGSPEILMHSKSAELSFSAALGEQFSCNGDNIAALHGLPSAANGTSEESSEPAKRGVGPTITGMVHVPPEPGNERLGFWIQDFSVPASMSRLYSEIITTSHALAKLSEGDPSRHGHERDAEPDPCAVNKDMMTKTLLVGLIGHDSADGRLELSGKNTQQQGTLKIIWEAARRGQQLTAAHEKLGLLCKNVFPDASLLANPMWRLLPGNLAELVSQPLGPVLTVHPLGGCPMGSDDSQGVVDDCGRVNNLAIQAADDWFGTLVVLDGSIIPASLGANPSLTISAIALRAVEQLKQDWGYGTAGPSTSEPGLGNRPHFGATAAQTVFKPVETRAEVIERLSGHVGLQVSQRKTESFFVELTMAYKPVSICDLMAGWKDRLLDVDSERSQIRIFRSGPWQPEMQRFAFDIQRLAGQDSHSPNLVWAAPLGGTLRFLHREESNAYLRALRGLHAYFCNRGKRDLWQEFVGKIKSTFDKPGTPSAASATGWLAIFCNAVKLATHAGEVRRFDYVLSVKNPIGCQSGEFDQLFSKALAGQTIKGEKRLTYNRRANPWRQLTTLQLTSMPMLSRSGANYGDKLTLDLPFLMKQGLPLIRLVQQQNQAVALLDMASFGLYLARVILSVHFFTFRKPDTAIDRPLSALPGPIKGLPDPVFLNLQVGVARRGVVPIVRLTHYARTQSDKPPLVFIHGYSVSGTTFTHPSLNKSAAQYFWEQGRDIWVLDLRTSSGMTKTATVPWSIEEVALVDIPAALLHIRKVTGQRLDVVAHCIGAVMFSIAVLTDPAAITSDSIELGVDTWITLPQLDKLAEFNGVAGQAKHPVVRSVVLSQKGPLLRYTESNVFRAYLLGRLRRWLVPAGYSFKAKSPAQASVADQLLDRLLASLPYPDADYDVENPPWPWQTTPWVGTRHRMDALYARDFSAGNLSSDTLNAIDDLFGPINLDTVAQTIHFVRFNCATNQRGRGEFVTIDNLHQRWRCIPTLAIHGAGNGLVDVSTQTLLEKNFIAAGVPFDKKTYPGLGHQDVWIGTSCGQVFEHINAFLKNSPAAPIVPQCAALWRFGTPWIGPRLVAALLSVDVMTMSSPKYGQASTVLVPVAKAAQGSGYRVNGHIYVSQVANSQDWMKVTLPASAILSCKSGTVGWLAVIAYACGQTTLTEADTFTAAGSAANAAAGVVPTSDNAQVVTDSGFNQLVASWLTAPDTSLEECFIDHKHLAKMCAKPGSEFTFALGSCQYPGGILDTLLAEKSIAQLAAMTMADSASASAFVIFAGDQIYADASAGLVDPTRVDERFNAPYEAALRTAPMRQLMRCVPTYMLPDDHEMIDNWEPAAPKDKRAARLARVKRQGMAAYWKYQRMSDTSRKTTSGGISIQVSFSFDYGYADFYMLDTRTQRFHRTPGSTRLGQLFPHEQAHALKTWLLQTKAMVKFVVSPSMLFPRRLDALSSALDAAARSDGWQGYLADRDDLLVFIASNQIKNVIFLSGDEHLSCVANATLQSTTDATTASTRIASIHASGLYAPFPFANAHPEDFVQGTDNFVVGNYGCASSVRFAPAGSAFACIKVDCRSNLSPAASVSFSDSAGSTTTLNVFPDEAPV